MPPVGPQRRTTEINQEGAKSWGPRGMQPGRAAGKAERRGDGGRSQMVEIKGGQATTWGPQGPRRGRPA